MSEPVIFKDLPATLPKKDKYKKPSVVSSLIFHGLLVLGVVVIPLLTPQALPKRELLMTLVAPPPPPPPPPPPAPVVMSATARRTADPVTPQVMTEALVTPTVVPKVVVSIVEAPVAPIAVGGIPGGLPGGVSGGVLGGVLSANSVAPSAPVPPPPPPPPPPVVAAAPTGPIRVGGMVKEPRPIRMVPPIYPPLASRAHVSGIVVLEATLTADGTVSEIRVVSGHPLLTEAAIHCVRQWQYEPTLLNGAPVAVILTAKVHFDKAPLS